MRFYYLRDKPQQIPPLWRLNRGAPVGCLVTDEDPETGIITFAVSVCNKLDEFDRKVARTLAAGRLLVGPNYTINTLDPREPEVIKLVRVLGVVASDKSLPNKAREGARRFRDYLDSKELKQIVKDTLDKK